MKKFFCVLALAVFISGCASVPPTPRPGEINLKDLCDRYDVQLESDSVSQVVTLSGPDFKARALIGSDVVIVGPEKVTLSNKVRRARRMIIVPPDFEDKILRKVKKVSGVSLRKFKKIVVDAGHGGKDPGARGRSGVREKFVVLDIAKRLKRNLMKNGFQVIMTRDKDEFISLEKRTEIATRAKADLFVSVHANSNHVRALEGIEVYYMGTFLTKDRNENQRVKNEDVLFRHLAVQRSSSDLEDIITDMLYNFKQTESRPLAARLAREAAKSAGAQNRGDRQARFFVLRNTLIPSILVETGYLSNSKEEKLLQSGSYRQKIADGIAEGIRAYVD